MDKLAFKPALSLLSVRISPILLLCGVLSFVVNAKVQAALTSGAFDARFFVDLSRIFGELQRTELDRAFQGAKTPQCSELAGMTEWKQVAYLNDDRWLADWYFDPIEEVKKDPSKYVFKGNCRAEDSSLNVSTSFPVLDARTGSVLLIRDNAPVAARFDHRSHSIRFALPNLYHVPNIYLYKIPNSGLNAVNSFFLIAPSLSSTPEPNFADEVSCKGLSDAEMTYCFLLCRVRLLSGRRRFVDQVGGSAYYILSDGTAATSTVKLKFQGPVKP